ncbi:hypothetical protein PSQ19_03885 [Devosia algicola]|uniref:Uncharacterized protein n=1 Tax=Devosia algicola TaxID=3026418 RepID=A0ABY7YPR3_9HYPH|nr:hypothetical protein [Devosia algicola]WDR03303.1 hypothetical protein PSQ19_03885 [Devosia algicola]
MRRVTDGAEQGNVLLCAADQTHIALPQTALEFGQEPRANGVEFTDAANVQLDRARFCSLAGSDERSRLQGTEHWMMSSLQNS